MSLAVRRISGVALAVTLGFVFAVFEPHRHILAAVWPYWTAFWDYYIAF